MRVQDHFSKGPCFRWDLKGRQELGKVREEWGQKVPGFRLCARPFLGCPSPFPLFKERGAVTSARRPTAEAAR